jgi:hypothetical protein
MQTEINEKIGKLYECVSKPLTKITELNIATINKMANNTDLLTEVTQAKKPEDFIAAQVKLASTAATEGLEYLQQLSAIWMETLSQTGTTFATAARDVHDTTKKATENMKPSKL